MQLSRNGVTVILENPQTLKSHVFRWGNSPDKKCFHCVLYIIQSNRGTFLMGIFLCNFFAAPQMISHHIVIEAEIKHFHG